MKKEDLVRLIAEKTGATKAQATEAYEGVVQAIIQAIQTTGYANIMNLCSFSLVVRARRVARNPRTGEQVVIPAGKVVKIKPMKALRDAVEK